MLEMKNSGINWIGNIPKNWSVMPIKYLKANEDRAFVDGPFGSNLKSEHFVEDGDVYVIESGCISTGKFIFKNFKTITNEHFLTIDRSECKENDIIIAKIGANYGMAAELPLLDKRSVVSGNSLKLTLDSQKMDNYLFVREMELAKKNGGFINIVNETAQPALSLTILNNFRLVVPPAKKQKMISHYLKLKCDEIDELLADIYTEIDTLEEYKRSIITEKVTKGLNPDVLMKDSCIEWIGLIPSSWNIHPVYYYFGERKAKNYDLKEQNLLSLSYGKIIRKDINASGGLLPANFSTYNIVEAGDIIIRPTDLQNDKRSLRTGLVTEHGIITSAYIALMPKSGVNSKYFHYLLHAYDLMKVFYNMGNGVRQGLNYSEFSKLMVIAPSREEQQEIVDYLDNKCEQIDSIIETKKEQLTVLDEYKKVIVYEYATGKKEVP
jgi:type I restriction enzyme S subunit